MGGNSQVEKQMQSIASELKSSQGGTSSSLESTDNSCQSDTKYGNGFDLTGHGSK